MRLFLTLLIVMLALACNHDGTTDQTNVDDGKSSSVSPPADTTVSLGTNFRLSVGSTVRIESEPLVFRFDTVAADSRCPTGVQCVWAGTASTVIAYADDRDTLHTAGGAHETHRNGYVITLVALDPYPVHGRPMSHQDYVATFIVTKL